jgi:hypothetical protein
MSNFKKRFAKGMEFVGGMYSFAGLVVSLIPIQTERLKKTQTEMSMVGTFLKEIGTNKVVQAAGEKLEKLAVEFDELEWEHEKTCIPMKARREFEKREIWRKEEEALSKKINKSKK